MKISTGLSQTLLPFRQPYRTGTYFHIYNAGRRELPKNYFTPSPPSFLSQRTKELKIIDLSTPDSLKDKLHALKILLGIKGTDPLNEVIKHQNRVQELLLEYVIGQIGFLDGTNSLESSKFNFSYLNKRNIEEKRKAIIDELFKGDTYQYLRAFSLRLGRVARAFYKQTLFHELKDLADEQKLKAIEYLISNLEPDTHTPSAKPKSAYNWAEQIMSDIPRAQHISDRLSNGQAVLCAELSLLNGPHTDNTTREIITMAKHSSGELVERGIYLEDLLEIYLLHSQGCPIPNKLLQELAEIEYLVGEFPILEQTSPAIDLSTLHNFTAPANTDAHLDSTTIPQISPTSTCSSANITVTNTCRQVLETEKQFIRDNYGPIRETDIARKLRTRRNFLGVCAAGGVSATLGSLVLLYDHNQRVHQLAIEEAQRKEEEKRAELEKLKTEFDELKNLDFDRYKKEALAELNSQRDTKEILSLPPDERSKELYKKFLLIPALYLSPFPSEAEIREVLTDYMSRKGTLPSEYESLFSDFLKPDSPMTFDELTQETLLLFINKSYQYNLNNEPRLTLLMGARELEYVIKTKYLIPKLNLPSDLKDKIPNDLRNIFALDDFYDSGERSYWFLISSFISIYFQDGNELTLNVSIRSFDKNSSKLEYRELNTQRIFFKRYAQLRKILELKLEKEKKKFSLLSNGVKDFTLDKAKDIQYTVQKLRERQLQLDTMLRGLARCLVRFEEIENIFLELKPELKSLKQEIEQELDLEIRSKYYQKL